MSTTSAPIRATPWHVWVVAFLTFFWNGSGAVTIVMAQMGRPLDLNPNEIAYYADQPFWFVLATDLALVLPLAAAVALLLRSRSAAWLFALSLLTVALNDAYDLAAGTSLALVDRGWLGLMIVVVVIALAQIGYARTMTKRGGGVLLMRTGSCGQRRLTPPALPILNPKS